MVYADEYYSLKYKMHHVPTTYTQNLYTSDRHFRFIISPRVFTRIISRNFAKYERAVAFITFWIRKKKNPDIFFSFFFSLLYSLQRKRPLIFQSYNSRTLPYEKDLS